MCQSSPSPAANHESSEAASGRESAPPAAKLRALDQAHSGPAPVPFPYAFSPRLIFPQPRLMTRHTSWHSRSAQAPCRRKQFPAPVQAGCRSTTPLDERRTTPLQIVALDWSSHPNDAGAQVRVARSSSAHPQKDRATPTPEAQLLPEKPPERLARERSRKLKASPAACAEIAEKPPPTLLPLTS